MVELMRTSKKLLQATRFRRLCGLFTAIPVFVQSSSRSVSVLFNASPSRLSPPVQRCSNLRLQAFAAAADGDNQPITTPTEQFRKMATVRRINDILPIQNADSIECAVLGGWKVVIQKGEFKAGDLAVYCEIDSWIPTAFAPFLSKGKEPSEFEGIKGERLRTVKLRGQLSQGLLLSLDVLGGDKIKELESQNGSLEGVDVSELLNIQKWEKVAQEPQVTKLDAQPFPSFIRKTDQERIQNLGRQLSQWIETASEFEITEKLEGTSITIYRKDGHFGVCSRNLDIGRTEQADAVTMYWRVANETRIEDQLASLGYDNIAIQGELIGPGIQKNIYKLKEKEIRVFDVFDITRQAYLLPEERLKLVESLNLKHVPSLGTYTMGGDTTMESILALAEGKSLLNKGTEREGLVFKSGPESFKAISNKYLLNEK